MNADDIPTWRGMRKMGKINFTKQLKHETECQDGTPDVGQLMAFVEEIAM